MKKKNQHHHAVIMAGGVGTRFWPLSRQKRPKQFLPFFEDKTLIALTIERLLPLFTSDQIWIAGSRHHRSLILKTAKQYNIPSKNCLFEPSPRNTAPCIAYVAHQIERIDPAAVFAVFPSDHIFLREQKFHQSVRKAFQLAEQKGMALFGIQPTRPDTGYGYFQVKKVKSELEILKFKEKPSLAKAKEYLKAKSFLWNSGMFVWKVDTIQQAFQKFQPEITKFFQQYPTQQKILKHWNKLPSISIDYAIMEKMKGIPAVLLKDSGWSDVGSWEAYHYLKQEGKSKNTINGSVINLESKNSLMMNLDSKKQMICLGCDDLIVINTQDALLITPLEKSQSVKDVVTLLAKQQSSLL